MSQALLAEFEYGIAHLSFVLPQEEKEKIIRVLETLKADEQVSEEAIKKAMFEVGVVEYPYRNAYKEVFAQKEVAEFLSLVLHALTEELAGKFEAYLAGRSLKEGVNDAKFMEAFVPEERQLIEKAMNDCKQQIPEAMKSELEQDAQLFDHALVRHTKERDELLALIQEITVLSETEGTWQEELRAVLERAKEGFLITEPDPEQEELKRIKDYWNEVIKEGK